MITAGLKQSANVIRFGAFGYNNDTELSLGIRV